MFANLRSTLLTLCVLLVCTLAPDAAVADSVGQIATGVRISRTTAALLDPQGRPGAPEMGTDTAARPGDILTFVAHFTPVPNGGARGLGGYVTVYIPRNTEVVAARIIDRDGNTVAPRRGGFSADGLGPRHVVGSYAGLGLDQGSISQLYADTGIFYSLSTLTERVPDGSVANEAFLALDNGILMDPEPTAAKNLSEILNNGVRQPTYAHNTWDYIQALAFGVDNGAINDRGQGNAPDGYGSAVAGPNTWYDKDAILIDAMMPLIIANVTTSANAGPWERIRTIGGEIGRRGMEPPMPDPGEATRIGILAEGNDAGLLLDGATPLPAFDPDNPDAAHVTALRFAVGELLVGTEYLSEFSLRVLDTPLDPVVDGDVVCAEVFGGDASAELLDGTKDGKDNSWRYFVPAPACVSLNLLFDIDVDKLAAVAGEPLTYDITAQNLSLAPHTNVEIRHCYDGGALSFVSATGGGTEQAATGECAVNYDREVIWTIADWQPGDLAEYTIAFTVDGGVDTVGRAVFTSDELMAPGFQTVAYTVIDSISIVEIDMMATPSRLPDASGQVTFTLTVDNDGTGTPNLDYISVLLPPGFTYDADSTVVNGVPVVGDPMQPLPGDPLIFNSGLVDPPRQTTMVLEFTATVDGGAAQGPNTSTIDIWFTDPFKGETINNSKAGVAEVIIGAPRSDAPVISGPLLDGDNSVSGTTGEAEGTIIRLYLAGVELPFQGTSDVNGNWTVSGLPDLFAGQRISASAEAPSELEGARSGEETVVGAAGGGACDDGMDNDGDGLVDLADPDCESAGDPDETHTPECADGVDNDGDGEADFGNDDGCSDLTDDDEEGEPACSDGEDNDGDGLADHPDDPGCDSEDDVSEADLPACADGIDNDDDGELDFPNDNGCESALDDNELAGTNVRDDPDPMTMPDAGTGGDGDGDGGDGDSDPDGGGSRADAAVALGGVDEPDIDGCGCSVPGAGGSERSPLWLLAGLVLLRLRRRRGA